METYQRRRSTRNINEMMNLKRQENSIVDGARSLPLARQILPTSNEEIIEQDIELGSVYEIDHKNLPPRTPVQLRSIRVVMVSEKTDLNVSIRYPSIASLSTYFSNRIKEMYPALDEKFVMGVKLAGKVLYQQVPSQEFAEKKYSEEFWLVNPTSLGGFNVGNVITKKDDDTGLVTELKGNGMVTWGIRRQVMFIGKHRDYSNTQSSSSFVQCGGKVKGVVEQVVGHDDDDEEEGEEKDDDDDDDEEEDVNEETQKFTLKRKRRGLRRVQKLKKVKREKQIQVYKAKNKCKQLVLRDPTDRWSQARYKSAEQSLLEVMKENGAVIGNPILRPALRAEARKRIGDTGLLDHLLKHVAGKLAPGGVERFRRWHNAEGAMEYWLEDADLINIRREAGVTDPFWTPLPGWKPGDSPTQDPICAKELKIMREEIANIKGNMGEMMSKKEFEEEMTKLRREMVSKKQFEEELAKVRRDMEELISKKEQNESQITVVSDPVAICPNLDLSASLVPLESEVNADNLVSVEKYKEQLLSVSNFLRKIEISKGTARIEEGKTKYGTELITTTEAFAEKATQKLNAVALLQEDEEKSSVVEPAIADQKTTKGAEEKAAKIERLKSGFRICKPQGTFLWPNMGRNPTSCSDSSNMLSPQVVVQVEDLFVVPTPPSVSSSTGSAPPQLPYHHHQPASPVKPLAERRAVTVTVSTISEGPACSHEDVISNNYSSTTTTTTTTTTNGNKSTTLINLNDIPTTTTVMPNLLASGVKREMMVGSGSAWEVYGGGDSTGCSKIKDQQERQLERKKSSSSSSSSNTGRAPTWLALATPHPAASDQHSSRG